MINFLLSIISGILLALSFPKPEISLFAWFGFVFLFAAIEKTSSGREAFLLSYICGLVFFSIVTYWLVYVSFIGAFVLVTYLALYFGIFGAGVKWLSNNFDSVVLKILLMACLWTGLEFARAHLFSGFGWALLGYSQYENIKLIQIADITGAYGISFLLIFSNGVIFYTKEIKKALFDGQKKFVEKNKIIQEILAVSLIWAALFYSLDYGEKRIKEFRRQKESILKVSVVQGNIAQEFKWDKVLIDLILSKYEKLTQMAAFDKPDVIIWPETSLPGYLNEEKLKDRISKLAASAGAPLLIGAPRFAEEEDIYFNSAAYFGKTGSLIGTYDKMHLVPFGEYLPFKDLLSPLAFIYPIADFSAGKDYHLFKTKDVAFGVLICFEDVFPEVTRKFVKEGADFMVNITNDAWFKNSPAAYQHNQALVFRAVENKIGIARAGNTGPSLFIEPVGVMQSRLQGQHKRELFIDGFLTADVFGGLKPTFYTKFGDIFAYICAAFFAVIWAGRIRGSK